MSRKIFLSADMEGTCGITAWCETDKGQDLYEHFREQMTREVAAACEGALAAGADDVMVKDGHDSARNINPNFLPEQVRILRGWARHPYSMMAGLDESYDGVLFTGYHSAAQMNTSPLSHTMNLQNNFVKLNDELCPELMLNSLTASYVGVPVYLVTGDKGLCSWMNAHCPGTTTVPVNEGIGSAMISINPALAVKRIRAAAESCFEADPAKCMFPMPKSFKLEISYKEHWKATSVKWYPGCVQLDERTVRYESKDYMDVLTFIHFCL